MNLTFKNLLGVIPRAARTVGQIVAAGVSVKKEERTKLSTSDKLKLANASREGGEDKFTFFESDGKVGGDFRAVYDLHMRLEALSKAVLFYDMDDVSNIIPCETVKLLESKLSVVFSAQKIVGSSYEANLQEPTKRNPSWS